MLTALILFGLLGLGALIALIFVGVIKTDRDRKKAETNSQEALDALFNGKPDVTFTGNMRTMRYETVILGAKERGYTLTTQGGDPKGAFTLLFEKA